MKRLKNFYLFITVIFCLLFLIVIGIQIFGFIALLNIQSSLAENNFRIEKTTEADKNLSSLKTKFKDIQDDIPRINIALPNQKDSSALISDLDSLAQSSGLKFTMLQTNTVGKKDTSQGDLSLLQTVKGKYGYEMPIEIKVEGSFVSFADFISRLENYQRLVNITSINIAKTSVTGEMTDKIEAKIKLTAYLKK